MVTTAATSPRDERLSVLVGPEKETLVRHCQYKLAEGRSNNRLPSSRSVSVPSSSQSDKPLCGQATHGLYLKSEYAETVSKLSPRDSYCNLFAF